MADPNNSAAAPGSGTGAAAGGAQPAAGTGLAAAAGGTPPAATPSSDWSGSLSADVRTALAPKKFATVEDLGKAYLTLETKIGAKGVILPGKDAKPEELAEFHRAIGVPESPEKYDLSGFKVPEGLPWDGAAQNKIVAAMHKAGATPAVVQAALQAYSEHAVAQASSVGDVVRQQLTAATEALKKEWGNAYDAKLEIANRTLKFAFGDQTDAARQLRLADGSFVLDHPLFAKALAKVGEGAIEPGALEAAGGGSFAMTPDQAKREIANMERDPHKGAILSGRAKSFDPQERKDLLARRDALYQIAYPEEKAS